MPSNSEVGKPFRFVDLYAGIGGFHIACADNGGSCAGFSETDKLACRVYLSNHGDVFGIGDINKADVLPCHDLMTAGVPCQSWSSAGRRKGFGDERGLLWFKTIEHLKKSQPKAFLFENVKGLADPRNKDSLGEILRRITQAGYSVKTAVLNARDYGTPQARERLYLAGFREAVFADRFEWPETSSVHPPLWQFLGREYAEGDDVSFIFSDVRDGPNTIHSWDLSDGLSASLCLLMLKNRRSRRYGNKDGNPMTAEQISDLAGFPCCEALDGIVSSGVLEKINGCYDFRNRKISSGISGVYRIVPMTSTFFPTLVASGNRDFICESPLYEGRDSARDAFIRGDYRPASRQECAKLQGFPDGFILPDKRAE